MKSAFLHSKGLLCLSDNKIIHGCLKIWNFSSRVQLDISLVRCALQHSKRNSISTRTHVLFSILNAQYSRNSWQLCTWSVRLIFLTDMYSFCWPKCGPRPKLFTGVHALIFTCVPYIVIGLHEELAILIGKSEVLLSWLVIYLLFWWFYFSFVRWLRKYQFVKIRLHEGLKYY